MGSGVYFNPYCKVGDLGVKVKYGVISTSALEEDLRAWKHLYVAGRLHKPVLSLKRPSLALEDAIRKNHQTALRAVLLQEGIQMTKTKLYEGICELSYLGDTRMLFAEHPRKIANIVAPLINEFDKIYLPLLNATGLPILLRKGW
ncbi:Phosphatidate cytidylyltransferase, mitochondrial [Orchesella cincta]|uniref:Phosphatidate cytidylyltransferase, mitochondrial n=1 Tax=Orchesella cincta TaxID=48709 RepID=A0A1D2MP35_ORCCI|nr:Phosphatidate cytidylyltransferase, mitochondrial [Orchesella cincta]